MVVDADCTRAATQRRARRGGYGRRSCAPASKRANLAARTIIMLVVLAAVAATLLALFATLNLLRRRCSQTSHKGRKCRLALHFAATNDVTFAYHQCGRASDPLVLVLHGFPDTAASMCPLLPSLAARGAFFPSNSVYIRSSQSIY
jgi:hypothetical protein